MPRFRYKMVKNDEVVEETAEAPDRFALYRQVRKEGGAILDVEEVSEKGFALGAVLGGLFKRVSPAEKIIFARNLSAMLSAGLALSRALSVLERQTKNKAFEDVIKNVREDIGRGGTLHAALAKFPNVFPPVFASMVKAGEESGGLAQALSSVAVQLDRMLTLSKRVRGALLYPAIVIIAMIAVGVLMLVYIVPALSETFREFGAELPASTQAIISASDALIGHPFLALSILLLVVLASLALARTRRGRRTLDLIAVKLPVVGLIVKQTNAARTARTLASLLSAGVEVITAVSITGEVLQNVHYKEVLSLAGERIEKGSSIAETFAQREDLYPVLVAEMIAVGEETGKLSDMLRSVADFYEAEVEQQTKNLSSVIEPFLMVVVGSVVGFFAISMISPIYSLSSSI